MYICIATKTNNMENTHDVQYILMTNDGRFVAPFIAPLSGQAKPNYTNYARHAEFLETHDRAIQCASEINGHLRNIGDPVRVKVVRREIYHTYDESIDTFPID